MPCVLVLAAVGLLAWPIWRYSADRALFERRALLASVATPESWVGRWLWSGRFAVFGQALVALLLAAILLGFLASLQRVQLAILVADALLLGLIYGRAQRLLED